MTLSRAFSPALLVLAAVGCAGRTSTLRMNESPLLPAAQGTVKVRPADNGNTALDVRVNHLARPDRVQPGASTYVVWAQAPGQATLHNLGGLRVDKDLEGVLQTITPLRTFQLFLTAEPTAQVTSPSGQPLLSVVVQ